MDLVEEDDHGWVADLDEQVAKERRFGGDARRERQQGHVEDAHVSQRLRDGSGRDAQRQALHDGRLARAGRTEQERIALRQAQQDLHDRVKLPLAPHDRAQLAVPGQAHEVAAEPLKGGRRGGTRRPHDGRRDRIVSRDGGGAHDDGVGDGLLQQVDGLVREPPVGDGAVSKIKEDVERVVRRRDAAALGQGIPDAHEDRPGGRLVQLIDRDGREAAGEGLVEGDRRAVVLRRGRPDHRDVAPREGGLEDLARADAAFRASGRRQQVDLVEEQDEAGLARLAHELGDALLELAAVLRPGGERGERHLDDPCAEQRRGDAAGHDALGEALHDGRLAHTGRPEQHGVALRAAQEDLDHPLGLGVAAEHRLEQPLGGELRQVTADLVQERGGLRARCGRRRRRCGRGGR